MCDGSRRETRKLLAATVDTSGIPPTYRMHLVRLLPPPLALLLLVIGSAAPVHAAVCAGTDAAPALCPPGTGPCVVSTDCSLPSGFVADLGARPLLIQANKTITIPDPGIVKITANGITLEGGAKIVAEGGGTPSVELVSTSTTTGITMEAASRITTGSRGDGGIVDLRSNGPVVMRGSLRAPGPSTLDVGGDVSIQAQGNILIDGTGSGIDVSGGLEGFGGYIDITSLAGTVTIDSELKLDGGDGGALSIDALGNVDVQTGTLIDVGATLGGGYGGEVDISGHDVQVAAAVAGTGKREDDGSNEPTFSGGDGAAVTIDATGNLAVNGTFDIKGGPGGTGGDFEIQAVGSISLLGKVLARAEGKYGAGSDSISVWSDSGDITVGATLDAAGGWAGGSIEIVSFSRGGTVRLTSTADLSAATLDGLPADEQIGGTIDLDACAVEVQAGSLLSTTGLQGVNVVHARSSLVIAGALRAGSENRLEYRDQPGIISIVSSSAQIVPAAHQVANPALSCCGAACVPPSTTTTSLPPTTTSLPPTTTTTFPPTTTSSLPPTTSTTPAANDQHHVVAADHVHHAALLQHHDLRPGEHEHDVDDHDVVLVDLAHVHDHRHDDDHDHARTVHLDDDRGDHHDGRTLHLDEQPTDGADHHHAAGRAGPVRRGRDAVRRRHVRRDAADHPHRGRHHGSARWQSHGGPTAGLSAAGEPVPRCRARRQERRGQPATRPARNKGPRTHRPAGTPPQASSDRRRGGREHPVAEHRHPVRDRRPAGARPIGPVGPPSASQRNGWNGDARTRSRRSALRRLVRRVK